MDSSDTVVVVAETSNNLELSTAANIKTKSATITASDKDINDISSSVEIISHVNGVSEDVAEEATVIETNHVETNGEIITKVDHSNDQAEMVAVKEEDIKESQQNEEIEVAQAYVVPVLDDAVNDIAEKIPEDVPPVPLTRTVNVEAVQAVVADIAISDHSEHIAVGVNPSIDVNAPLIDAPATTYPAPSEEVATTFPTPIDDKPVDPNALPEFTIKALNDIAAKNGFESFSIRVEPGSKKFDGFVAEIYKATIIETAKPSPDMETRELILIVKLPPKAEFRRDFFGMKLFQREVFMYNEVLPVFAEFQRNHGLRPGVNGFFAYPRCHFALFDEAKNESVIIMDDVRYQDYYLEDRHKPTKYDNAKSAMQHLGQLHAISLAMKDQEPEKFEPFKQLKDVMTHLYDNELMNSMIDINVQKAIATLEPNEQKIKDKVLAYCAQFIDESKRCNNGELSEPFSILLHGDFHINNVMFKLELGIPKHVCLFDWQLSRYASPAIDILYFIFLCTDKPLRDQHFDHLIQAYHNSLREQLELLNADVNQLFPFTALLRQLKQFGKFVLGTAIFAIPMLCMERTEIPDMDEWTEKFKDAKIEDIKNMQLELSQKTEDLYKTRMSGVLRDMHKKGYF